MTRSWDFWDTLATRCVLAPVDVFAIVERNTGVAGFAAARVVAEAKSRYGVPETTLERIYAFLPYDEATRRTLLATELRVEEQLSSPIASNVVQWTPDDVVVSDMYLDRASMLRIAAACGINLPASRLFLSSEAGATKHTGALFDHVAKHVTLRSHVGDNRHSDVTVPARKGIRAIHFTESKATPTELEWQRFSSPDARLIAGLLRATRLAEPPAVGYVEGEWVLYAQLVAPLLLRFVDWTLRQCEQRGIEQLFFMARDGQVLYRIACTLLASRRSKIKAHYMYASRQALHLPGHVSMAQSASWIIDNTALLTLRVIAERIGIDVSTVATIAARYLTAGVDENLSAVQRGKLTALIGDPEFAELVQVSSSSVLTSAVTYLRQIGFFDPTYSRVGIVDVGWVGRIQRSLEGVSVKAGFTPERIHGFYLGLTAASVHTSGDRLVGMLADPYRADAASGAPWVNSFPGMFEFFLRATHPTTLRYEAQPEGLVAPVLGEALPDHKKQEIERKQNAILAFVERYCRLEVLIGEGLADALQHADDQVRRLLEKPTREEVAVFADHSHSEQQVEQDFIPIVRSLSITDAFARRTLNRTGIWPEGSYVISKAYWLFRLRRLVVGLCRYLYLRMCSITFFRGSC